MLKDALFCVVFGQISAIRVIEQNEICTNNDTCFIQREINIAITTTSRHVDYLSLQIQQHVPQNVHR